MESHLLLTGSTGLIGRRCLPLLLAADESRHISVLARDGNHAVKHNRVTVITGDLQAPQLGLDPATWKSLAGRVTDIVHCAADIRFNRSLEEARAVNTTGTRKMLALARESTKLQRFAHVSTTYVMGRDAGELAEREYRNRGGFLNTYERAKYEAECAVNVSMAEIPAAVFRLSSVAGAQTTYLQQALRLIPQNPFPFLPGGPDCRIDLISDQWAAATLSRLFERHFVPGSVYHVCAGPKASIPVSQLMEMAYAAMGVEQRPAMIPFDEFERFTERFLRTGEREAYKAILRSVSLFLPHLAINQSFQNAATMAMLPDESDLPPDSVEVVRKVFNRLIGAQRTSLYQRARRLGETPTQ